MKLFFKPLALICLILLSACYRITAFTDTRSVNLKPDAQITHLSSVFAMLELEKPQQIRSICPSGISKLQMQQTWSDAFFHYVTLGNYSVQTTYIWCKRRRLKETQKGD